MLLVRICLGPARRGFAGSGGFGFRLFGFRICLGFRYCDFGFPVLVTAAGRVRSIDRDFRWYEHSSGAADPIS